MLGTLEANFIIKDQRNGGEVSVASLKCLECLDYLNVKLLLMPYESRFLGLDFLTSPASYFLFLNFNFYPNKIFHKRQNTKYILFSMCTQNTFPLRAALQIYIFPVIQMLHQGSIL